MGAGPEHNELLDTPLNLQLTRWEMEVAIRDWFHKSEFNRCNMGTDECAMWAPARDLTTTIEAADAAKRAGL